MGFAMPVLMCHVAGEFQLIRADGISEPAGAGQDYVVGNGLRRYPLHTCAHPVVASLGHIVSVNNADVDPFRVPQLHIDGILHPPESLERKVIVVVPSVFGPGESGLIGPRAYGPLIDIVYADGARRGNRFAVPVFQG